MAVVRVKNSRILTIARRRYSTLHTARKTYEQPRTTPSKRDEPAKCAWRCGRVPRSCHVIGRQPIEAKLRRCGASPGGQLAELSVEAINGSQLSALGPCRAHYAHHAYAPTILVLLLVCPVYVYLCICYTYVASHRFASSFRRRWVI